MISSETQVPPPRNSNTWVSVPRYSSAKEGLKDQAKALLANPSTQPAANNRAHLEDGDIGLAIRSYLAAIHLNMLQPLDVWLGITVHLAVELYITS